MTGIRGRSTFESLTVIYTNTVFVTPVGNARAFSTTRSTAPVRAWITDVTNTVVVFILLGRVGFPGTVVLGIGQAVSIEICIGAIGISWMTQVIDLQRLITSKTQQKA